MVIGCIHNEQKSHVIFFCSLFFLCFLKSDFKTVIHYKNSVDSLFYSVRSGFLVCGCLLPLVWKLLAFKFQTSTHYYLLSMIVVYDYAHTHSHSFHVRWKYTCWVIQSADLQRKALFATQQHDEYTVQQQWSSEIN